MCPFILFLTIDRYASLEHTHWANTLMFMIKFQSFNVPSVVYVKQNVYTRIHSTAFTDIIHIYGQRRATTNQTRTHRNFRDRHNLTYPLCDRACINKYIYIYIKLPVLAQQTRPHYDAGVVDQHADAAERVVRPTERIAHRSFACDVACSRIEDSRPVVPVRNARGDDFRRTDESLQDGHDRVRVNTAPSGQPRRVAVRDGRTLNCQPGYPVYVSGTSRPVSLPSVPGPCSHPSAHAIAAS